MVRQMWEEVKAAGFLVIVEQILILATYPSAEINNSQNICHSGLLIVGITRCLSTHMEKWCDIERVIR